MRFLSFIILFLVSLNLSAQEVEETVAVTTSVEGDDILLRWAPNSPLLWFYANEYGYTVERYTFKRNGQLLDMPEKIVLAETVKPAPLEDWKTLAQNDDYAAVAAQCLFGETLEVVDGSTDIFTIANKAKEMESRFSFSLVAADQNVEVAKLSGLYFRDDSAKPDEYYLYRVYANVPNNIQEADTAAVYYGLPDFKGLPKPQLLDVQVDDEQVLIAWNTIAFDHIYNYYQVERSTDSLKGYEVLNGLPIVNVESGPRKNRTTGVYVDTTAQVQKYFYRVRARNAFGQMSPPSEALNVTVLPKNELPQPQIVSGENVDNYSVELNWSIPFESEKIKKVYLERSKTVKGPYERIKELDINKREIVDGNPKLNNYYKIILEDSYNSRESFPYYVQLVDSIPPAPSQIETISIKDRMVTINWKANKAEDLAGYRLYRSNFKNAEPFLINPEQLITDTVYQEAIGLKNLTKNAYYYLAAIDHVDNQSELSESKKVVKPDIIPPTLPIVKDIVSRNDSIIIDWIKSSSPDVKNYLVYRKESSSYKLAGVLSPSSEQFIDKRPSTKKSTILYRIVAVDSAGNEGYTPPVSVLFNPTVKGDVNINFQEIQGGLEIRWVVDKSMNKNNTRIYQKVDDHYNLIKSVAFIEGYVLLNGKVDKENIKVIFQ
jgi:hypothetical protein